MVSDAEIKKWQQDSIAKRERARKKRIADRTKEVRQMKWNPKERQTYLKALRYGRRQKAGSNYKAVPGIKFNGLSLGVMKDSQGRVHVISKSRFHKDAVEELGPRGFKFETRFSSQTFDHAGNRDVLKRIKSAFDSVSKGKYKKGSTGNRGG